MAVNFDPIVSGEDVSATNVNARLTDLDDAIEDIKDGSANVSLLSFAAATTLTISSGAVTVTRSYHVLAAESGVSDDLDTITAAGDRTIVFLQADAGDTITIKHGTGNISTWNAKDITLTGDDHLLLFYDGSNWVTVHPVVKDLVDLNTRTLPNLTDVDSASVAAANLFLATPSGGAGNYQGRAIVMADLPFDLPRRATMWHDEAQVVAGNPLSYYMPVNPHYYNTTSYQNTGANGDAFEQAVFLQPDTYDFNVLGISGPSYGLLDWYIKANGGSYGAAFASGQDWYAAAETSNVKKTSSGTVVIASSGVYIVKGVVNGKNGSSSGYNMVLTKYWLTPNGGY